MTPEAALEALKAHIEPGRAAHVAAYMKVEREYLGVPLPAVNALTQDWRRSLTLEERVSLAEGLWRTDIHEARIAAAKLLTQARIKGDEPVWRLIVSWLPDFDGWAIADHVCMAGQRRVSAQPARLDEVEGWTQSERMWTRRAALVITLPWTKQNHPKPGYVADREWFIQKAVAWWLRELSKHDPKRAEAFLAEHGAQMKAFARKEAGKYL